MRDPYAVLGVAKTASAADIKSAFRKLAKTCHPDANPNNAKAKERFAEVSRAYEIVGDPGKRTKYDRGEINAEGREAFSGHGTGSGFPGAGGFEDIYRGRGGGFSRAAGGPAAEDILNSVFGGGAQGSAGQRFTQADFDDMFGDPPPGMRPNAKRKARPARGHDIETVLEVPLAGIFAAGRVKLTLPDGRTIAVSVPGGVQDGQVIRLKGQGEPGPAGHRGDVLARVRIKPGPGMRIEGSALFVDVDVDLKTAVTGGKARVATPDGTIAVKIAPWTSSGHTLRVPGRGLPIADGPRGDLFATVRIVLEDADRAGLEALFDPKARRA